jgi:hypothetical protein
MSGVDRALRPRQPPALTGVGIGAAASLGQVEPRAGAALAVVGHDLHSGRGERVDDAVLAGRAHVVAGSGQRR